MIWNISSLVLGIVAWCFAFMAIKSKDKNTSCGCSIASFSLCATSLFFQFLEISDRVQIRDYAGIEDTIGAVIVAAGVLIGVRIVLNVIALVKKSKMQKFV